MAILEEVKEIITRYVKIEPEKITLESKLNEDLDADSIDIADVVMDIEEKYGFKTTAIVTMGEVVEHLYNRPYKGRVIIDNKLKEAIDAYYEQYGAEN